MSRINLGLLQMREKFAREALAALPLDAPAAERQTAIKTHSDAMYAHAHGMRQHLASQKLRALQ